MQVERIPDGWELVEIGVPKAGDWMINAEGEPHQATCDYCTFWPIIHKIEKPKRYRPFANAAEFEPHREKWFKCKSSERDHRMKTNAYNDRKHYTCEVGDTWTEMFDDFEFEDGTPFGVEVVE